MLKALSFLAAISIVSGASVNVAVAENVNVSANARMQQIYSFWRTYGNTCQSAPPPRYKIRQQPKHGRIIAQVSKAVVPPDMKRCAGKTAQFLAVGYQPNRGFRGKDTAQVTIIYDKWSNQANSISRTIRFNISVR